MKLFRTIKDYCDAINIPPPVYPQFDVRKFEDNMKTVVNKMEPFRHEFYALAIKCEGSGKALSGNNTNFPNGYVIFFNSPYQILSWDIMPDWEGFYLMFTQDFLAKSSSLINLLIEFPFLRMDKSVPLNVNKPELASMLSLFDKVFSEYHSTHGDKFKFIETYIRLLLLQTRRIFENESDKQETFEGRRSEIKLVTQLQLLIETGFYSNNKLALDENLHHVSYYAQKLSIHPNHLNSVVKRITGKTTLNLIHSHIILLAKSYLKQTEFSIKEISYSLRFNEPTHFNNFFKKYTGVSPQQYRSENNI